MSISFSSTFHFNTRLLSKQKRLSENYLETKNALSIQRSSFYGVDFFLPLIKLITDSLKCIVEAYYSQSRA